MPVVLESVIEDIYTFSFPGYPWSMKCVSIQKIPEYETDDEDVYSITVEVTQNDDAGNSVVKSDLYRLPKLVRGTVTAGGRKRKQSIYTALEDNALRIYSGGTAWGHWGSEGCRADISCRDNTFYFKDEHGVVLSLCKFSNFLKYMGLWKPEYAVKFGKDSLASASEVYETDVPMIQQIIKDLVIPERTLRKLRFLTKSPNLPNTLTKETVQALLYIIDNDTTLRDQPVPFDYRYLDTYEALAEELNQPRVKRSIRSDTTYKYSKNEKFYCTSLQKATNDFFGNKKNSSTYANFQEFTDTNALSVAEQSKKIFFESWNSDIKGFDKQRLNPQFFVGVVDPLYTADSNDINRKNELSKSAVIKNGEVFVTVYDKKFNVVELPVYDYLMSATLSGDNVNYEAKTFHPINGKYSVYKYGTYMDVTKPEDIDYIRMEDSILTESLAMIPFINKTQAMRAMLGAHMLTQALPVSGSQPSFLYTGEGKSLFDKTSLNVETPDEGTVEVITDNFMKINRVNNDKPLIIKRPEPRNGIAGSTNIFEPCVKVGDKVSRGETIFSCNSFKNREFAVSVPLFTAFTSWHGREHEDAVVISESAAKKFTHRMLETITVDMTDQEPWIVGKSIINEDLELRTRANLYDNLGFIKVGTPVKRGDPLLVWKVIPNSRDNEKAMLMRKLDKNAIYTEVRSADTPYDVPAGVVTKIEFNPVKDYMSKYSDNVTFMTLATHFATQAKDIRQKESLELGVLPKEVDSIMPKELDDATNPHLMASITFSIMYDNPLKVADKMSNWYGSKGVTSVTVPDDKMLRTADGKIIDIVISPLSVISRINISQLYVSSLGLISKELYKRIESFLSSDKSDKKEESLLKYCISQLLYETPTKPLQQVYDEGKLCGFVRIRAGAMDKHFTEELITDLLNKLEIKATEKLFDPITNMWTRIPIRVGYQDFMRLNFISEHKMKVTGTRRNTKIFGYGQSKVGGQKIGEQEAYALMAYGDQDLLQKFSTEKEYKYSRISQELLSIGLLLNDVRPISEENEEDVPRG